MNDEELRSAFICEVCGLWTEDWRAYRIDGVVYCDACLVNEGVQEPKKAP